MSSSNWLPKTTQHIKLTQRLMLHKTTFCTTNERTCIEKSGSCGSSPGNSPGSKEPVSTIVSIPIHPHRVPARPLQHVPRHIARAHLGPNKRGKQDQQDMAAHMASPAGAGHLRHHSAYTAYTEAASTKWLLFSRLREMGLGLLYKQT